MAKSKNGNGASTPEQPGQVNKMEAVRQAMKALGTSASRTEIQAFVKEHYGVEMNLDIISTYKANVALKSKKGKKAKPAAASAAQTTAAPKKKRRRRRRRKGAMKAAAAATPAEAVKAGRFGVEEIDSIKHLMRRVGASSLKDLIDVIGK